MLKKVKKILKKAKKRDVLKKVKNKLKLAKKGNVLKKRKESSPVLWTYTAS